MEEEQFSTRGTTIAKVAFIIVVIAVVGGGWFASAVLHVGADPATSDPGKTVQAYITALNSRDAQRACDLLTSDGQAQVARAYGIGNTLNHIASGLSPSPAPTLSTTPTPTVSPTPEGTDCAKGMREILARLTGPAISATVESVSEDGNSATANCTITRDGTPTAKQIFLLRTDGSWKLTTAI